MRTFMLLALLALPVPSAAQTPLVFEGAVPEGDEDFFVLPFEVPGGIAEIEVRHDDLSERNILDWGLDDPDGFRGWGGGNDEPAIVGAAAASRSYLPGPLVPGTWRVVVGKALIAVRPATYRVEVHLRESATLEPQTARAPYAPAEALETGARWYAGDFHVHSRESGDARPDLDEIASFARSRSLDFVALTEHNTVSHLSLIVDAQSRHPDLLFLPGYEWTSYAGHANAFGLSEWVDHRVGFEGATFEGAAAAFAAQGALLSPSHPLLGLGNICIGCAWEFEVVGTMEALEIGNGGWRQSGFIFGEDVLAFWDGLLDDGRRLAPLGGSDDHRAGVDLSGFQSPIGDPTTMVFAEALSEEAILAAVRAGRTVVKMQGPGDPMVELLSLGRGVGDTVEADEAPFTVTVTGGAGELLVLVQDGRRQAPLAIDADPFVFDGVLTPPATGETRLRAEVRSPDDVPRTVTGHLWFQRGPPVDEPETGCGCGSGAEAAGLAGVLLLVALAGRRRRPEPT